MCGNLRICLFLYFSFFFLLVYKLREELVGEPLDLLVRVVELAELGVVEVEVQEQAELKMEVKVQVEVQVELQVQVQVDKVPYPAARVPVERCEVRQVERGATTVRLAQLGGALVPWGGEVR